MTGCCCLWELGIQGWEATLLEQAAFVGMCESWYRLLGVVCSENSLDNQKKMVVSSGCVMGVVGVLNEGGMVKWGNSSVLLGVFVILTSCRTFVMMEVQKG